jgi:hemolysin activation/secretion protein
MNCALLSELLLPKPAFMNRSTKNNTTFRIPKTLAKAYSARLLLALSAAAFVACPFAAVAQIVAPSQVTPKTLRPAPTHEPGELLLSAPPGLHAPPGAKDLSVIVGRLEIEGAFPELDSATSAFAEAVEGQRVTVARIYELANNMEQAYGRAGYILVRITVPPQKLNDHGSLRIIVVDGFIEKVQVDNVPDRVRALVADRIASLVGRHHVKLDEIERRLLISGDVPGLRLKSTLARGATPGGTLLVLEGTQQLVTATTSIDNNLPSSLGNWSYSASAALNSPFGFGEQFYASAQSGVDLMQISDLPSPLRVFGGGAVLPLGLDGWILNPEYTYSRSQPVPANGSVASVGQFQRFALRTSYPLIRTRTQTLVLTGAFEHINQSVVLPMFATDLNKDVYGVLRTGAAYEAALPWWDEILQTSVTFSHGVDGRDIAEASASGIPLSRQGAGPFFAKANADAHLTQPLPEAFRFDLFGHAQTSFGKPLLVSEQFSIDGPQAISAYPSGTLNVDEGGVLRGELSRPFALPGVAALILSPYGFGAFGAGRLIDPTILEVAEVRAGAIGAGIRSSVDMPDGYQGATLALELARQFSNLPNLAHGWRGNVSLSVRF